jgi:hypothetical protein
MSWTLILIFWINAGNVKAVSESVDGYSSRQSCMGAGEIFAREAIIYSSDATDETLSLTRGTYICIPKI